MISQCWDGKRVYLTSSLLERWDKMEKAQRVAEDVVKEVKKAGLSADTVENIKRQILGIGQ